MIINPVFTFWLCIWADVLTEYQDCADDLREMIISEVSR